MNTRAILAAVVLLTPFAAAQYGGGSVGGSLSSRGSTASGNRFLFNSDLQFTELKGVYSAVGMQTPVSAQRALNNNTMPDCSLDNGINSYTGLDYGSGQFYILAGSGSSVNSIVANQQRSIFSPNATYNSSIVVTMRNGVPQCTHFRPYINLLTGELLAESITITQWTENATAGAPTRTSLNCEVTGNEMPGCYPGSIATSGAASSPSVSVSSIGAPAPRPAGAIRTVSKNTWTCVQGECLRLNPKYSTTTPAYGA